MLLPRSFTPVSDLTDLTGVGFGCIFRSSSDDVNGQPGLRTTAPDSQSPVGSVSYNLI